MQIFRYIYLIWEDYEKEMEKLNKGISKTKNFRYPPVLPIVYYEGKQKWTAPTSFKARISMQEMFGDMVPDFTYQLVQLNDYSNEELLDKGDAISLLMMLGKIKTPEDISRFMKLPLKRLAEIIDPIPDYLVKKIAQIFRVWLFAMNTPEDEVEKIVSRVEEKNMGRLFEGMEIDIQVERRNLREERQQVEYLKQEVAEMQQEVAEGRKAIEEGQKAIEEGQKAIEEGQKAIEERRKAVEEDQKAIEERRKAVEEDKRALAEDKKTFAKDKRVFAEDKRILAEERQSLAEEWLMLQKERDELEAFKKKIGMYTE